MQRGLKVICFNVSGAISYVVSMQRGLKDGGGTSLGGWGWCRLNAKRIERSEEKKLIILDVSSLNAKRIERSFQASLQARSPPLSQCKED